MSKSFEIPDVRDLIVTVTLPKMLIFRLKVALLLMRLASLVGGYQFVVEEDEEVCSQK
jgi:hypothetical protein